MSGDPTDGRAVEPTVDLPPVNASEDATPA